MKTLTFCVHSVEWTDETAVQVLLPHQVDRRQASDLMTDLKD